MRDSTWSTHRSWTTPRGSGRVQRVRLSIVIPCFNEAATIDAIVAAVRASPHADKEIIVVGDGSVDRPRERVRHHLPPSGMVDHVVFPENNRGQGAAPRSG